MTELRHCLRQLLRAPVFTAAAVITLALALAAATTIFSVYNAVLYRPARAMDWDGVYSVHQMDGRGGINSLELSQIDALQAYRPDAIVASTALGMQPIVIQHQQRALKGYAELVAGDFGSVYRVTPQVGRLLGPADDRIGTDVALVSAGLWREWFGARRTLLEEDTIRINGAMFRIVGVMPPGVRSMWSGEVWVPAKARDRILTGKETGPPRWMTYARVRSGVSAEELRGAASAALAKVAPSPKGERGVRVVYWGRRSRGYGEVPIYGVTALLLLAACANLTNLMYARLAQRRAEVAVRLALGAGRLRIARGFILEIIAITAAAAAAGYTISLGVLFLLGRAFPAFRRDEWGMFDDIAPDARVILYAVSAAVIAAVVLAAVLSLNIARMSPARMLAVSPGTSATASGGRRFRSVLVAVQVTAAVVLVMGAGLWLTAARRDLDRASTFSDFQFAARELASIRLDLTHNNYNETRAASFQAQALAAVSRLPHVEATALTSGLPGASGRDGGAPGSMYMVADVGDRILGGRAPQVQASYAAVSPDFLRTIKLPLTRGREFNAADAAGAPLVVHISETLAKMLFSNADAVGQRLLFFNDKKLRTVVGVFRDPLVLRRGRWPGHNILALVPAAQSPRGDMMIVLRTGHPAGAAEAAAATVASLDPQIAIFNARSVEEGLLAETAPVRAVSNAMTALGALSLTFAALGIYGVMSFFVSTRVREFGIRLAIGATPRDVLRHVFREARLLLLFGSLCGVFLMAIAERLIDNRVLASMPNAVETWIAAIVLVLVTGLIATYFPARRASRTDPTVALREL